MLLIWISIILKRREMVRIETHTHQSRGMNICQTIPFPKDEPTEPMIAVMNWVWITWCMQNLQLVIFYCYKHWQIIIIICFIRIIILVLFFVNLSAYRIGSVISEQFILDNQHPFYCTLLGTSYTHINEITSSWVSSSVGHNFKKYCC